MTEIYATPIINNKFWIVEQNGEKVGTLRKDEENRFVLSNELGVKFFANEESVANQFGDNFFIARIIKESDCSILNEVHGFPTNVLPHQPMYDIKRKLPLFAKSIDSKSLYCAGYYVIQFDKGWVRSFCPKLITLQRYTYRGPYTTESEMKQVLANVTK